MPRWLRAGVQILSLFLSACICMAISCMLWKKKMHFIILLFPQTSKGQVVIYFKKFNSKLKGTIVRLANDIFSSCNYGWVARRCDGQRDWLSARRWLTADCKLGTSMNGCLSLCVSHVIDWLTVQGAASLSSYDSRGRWIIAGIFTLNITVSETFEISIKLWY